MKSLVEEASSVVKAIEKAWNRAGNPQTFSVKVFETPETNFFGFTKKSAKVGIFFEEEAPQPARKHPNAREPRSQNRPVKGRETTTTLRNTDTERAPRAPQSRQARPQSSPRPLGQVQPSRQEQPSREEAPAPRNRDEQRSPRPYEQRAKRPERQPREHSQGFVAEPTHEHDVPMHEEYMHDTYREQQEQFHNQAANPAPHQERYDREMPRRERDGRRDDSRGERRADDGRSERRDDNRGDRRGGRDDRRNDRGGRNGRPQRAQRHEFDEQREMVNLPDSHDFSSPSSSEPTHTAPETSAPTTLIPQKKVLKVSGRRYSAPAKPNKDNE